MFDWDTGDLFLFRFISNKLIIANFNLFNISKF
jgi:hypothetical protein